jgi:hypothetical protein
MRTEIDRFHESYFKDSFILNESWKIAYIVICTQIYYFLYAQFSSFLIESPKFCYLFQDNLASSRKVL